MTGTAAEIVPITKLDNHLIASAKEGPVTSSIRAKYEKGSIRESQEIYGLVNSCMVMNDDNLHFAVIGVGGWGKNHVRVLHDLGALEAICDMSADRAKEVGKLYGTKYYSSVSELFIKRKKIRSSI